MRADGCSFCTRRVGEGSHDGIIRHFETMDADEMAEFKINPRALADRLRKQPNRKVRIMLPGPGDLRICDICIDLYADTIKREFAAQG